MIELNSQMCEVFDLTYWQLRESTEVSPLENTASISREEKELLRKILLAKGVKLTDDMLELHANGVMVVHLNGHQLVFSDVSLPDDAGTVHLAKISAMLNDQEQKKLTWYKLKNLDL